MFCEASAVPGRAREYYYQAEQGEETKIMTFKSVCIYIYLHMFLKNENGVALF